MQRDIDAAVAALAAKQHGVFSRAQAASVGASNDLCRRRVRSGTWEELAETVFRIPGSPPTWRQRLMAATLEAGEAAAVSHFAAAALLKIPGFPEGPVEVVRWRGRHHRLVLATVHETSWLPEGHLTVIDGIRCTSLARCIFDLCGAVHPQRAARALENSLSQLGLTHGAAAEVTATMGRRGRPGTALMRRLVAERGPGYTPPDSELEALYLSVADAYALPPPDQQVRLGGDTFVGRVDFYYRDAKLVVEADSRRHHDSLLDREADIRRRAQLAAAGWRVIQVTWWQLVNEPEVVMTAIRRALAVPAS